MQGLVMCGGQSTRMGTDKGLIKTQVETWAQTAVEKIAALHLPVLLSVNQFQYPGYSTIFKEHQLVCDNPKLNVKGPLAGLLSVHLQYPSDDLFVLACDMPLMESSVLISLQNSYHKNPDKDAYIFANNGEPEPLCAIYTAKGLAHIMQLVTHNNLTRFSMKYILENLHVLSTPLEEEQKKCFRNFNSHAELNGL